MTAGRQFGLTAMADKVSRPLPRIPGSELPWRFRSSSIGDLGFRRACTQPEFRDAGTESQVPSYRVSPQSHTVQA